MPKYLMLMGTTLLLTGCVTSQPQVKLQAVTAPSDLREDALAETEVTDYLNRQEAILRQKLAGSGIHLVREGQNLRLILPSDLTFAPASSALTPKFYPALDAVASVLKEYPETLVEVTGYTDATGDAKFNQQLSAKRARSVARYLAAKGVASSRLLDRGMGDSKPIAPNDTPTSRAKNRRVEIRVHPMTQPP